MELTNLSSGLERSDMNPEEQLQRLYVAGFELQTFDRFPKAIGVLRDNCIAFLVPGPEGLQILGNVGWRMGESLGPLVERGGRKIFVHKEEVLEATPERIATLERFRRDLKAILRREAAESFEQR
jgi:hypothetical protein